MAEQVLHSIKSAYKPVCVCVCVFYDCTVFALVQCQMQTKRGNIQRDVLQNETDLEIVTLNAQQFCVLHKYFYFSLWSVNLR